MPRWADDREDRVQVTLRIKRTARDEVDRIAAEHPDPAMDRSGVLRAALGRGLPVIAREAKAARDNG